MKTRSPLRKKRLRRNFIILGSFVLLCTVIVAMCTPIYAPRQDRYDVHDIDAVFILGPPTDDRIALGQKIAREADGVPVYLSVWSGVVCKPEFVCVHASPWTTVGEARALSDAVRDAGVRHPLVITSDVHVMRARFIFDRCVPVQTPVIGVRPRLSLAQLLWQPIYQWGAMAKFAIGGCVDSAR